MELFIKPLDRIRGFPRVVRPLLRARKFQRQLRLTLNRTDKIKRGDILLFATLRNECWRMPFFLDYYRKLGVRHFLFVDNGSTDGIQEFLKQQNDCSCWHTVDSYRLANFGMHWLNNLLRNHGTGHWCITCDPDEFLVFPYCESRNLYELTEFLTGEKHDHLFCLLLDMYGPNAIRDTHCSEGQNPLEVTPYYDSIGYRQQVPMLYGDVFVQGGVRRRVVFHDHPERAPALNKTPLVLWKRHYAYVSSMHSLNLKRLNRPHKLWHASPTGCLLHFKFVSSFLDKAAEEMHRRQHFSGSIEYERYSRTMKSEDDEFLCEISTAYKDSKTLIEQGLMCSGQWF